MYLFVLRKSNTKQSFVAGFRGVYDKIPKLIISFFSYQMFFEILKGFNFNSPGWNPG